MKWNPEHRLRGMLLEVDTSLPACTWNECLGLSRYSDYLTRTFDNEISKHSLIVDFLAVFIIFWFPNNLYTGIFQEWSLETWIQPWLDIRFGENLPALYQKYHCVYFQVVRWDFPGVPWVPSLFVSCFHSTSMCVYFIYFIKDGRCLLDFH